MADEDKDKSLENNDVDEQQDSTAVDEDDLEAQMAATMAAESLSDSGEEDDLDAQMAAAIADELGEGAEEDSIESRLSEALGADSLLSKDMLAGLPDDAALEEGSEAEVKPVEFQQLRPTDEISERDNVDRLMDVSLSLSVELGRKQMQIREILDLGPGKIIELDKLAGEPVDLLVNGKLLARGEVVVVDENFGVRITDLISPKDRVRSL